MNIAAMAKRISFRVHGTVQGVNFRYFTKKKATEYNLTGWVRNTPNEKVEGEAQGADADVQALLAALNKGPTHAHVVKLEKQEIDVVDGETEFKVT